MACLLYLPKQRLERSPYADLASPSLHTDLEPLFAKEYCASLGMSRQVPLRVVGDIGGGGALARIEKARNVMKEKKSEWSQSDELPVCCSSACNLLITDGVVPTDRDTPFSRKPLSFDLRMSCLKGPVHRAESTNDDDLWTRYHEGQPTET